MKQRTHLEPGAAGRIHELVDSMSGSVESIFLVTGKTSFAGCGAESRLGKLLAGRQVVRFSDFEANPKISDVERGLAYFERDEPDLILAVGGGSVLDMAKLIGILSAQKGDPEDIIRGHSEITTGSHPVIAVPTTAGTGSEATHFAAVFIGDRKFSVAHPSMLPVVAIVDPELTYSLPPKTTAVTGLDAFSQAVESWWSVNATESSRRCAKQAIRLALDNLTTAVNRPSPSARHGMAKAAHLAGVAINITKTTAPHAISYTMTSRFGLPHGHAVALTLGPILVYNSRVTDDDVTSPRGTESVRQCIDELNRILGCSSATDSRRRITELIESLNLPIRLSEVGVHTSTQRQLIAEGVNPERLANNPRALPTSALIEILEEIT